MVPVPVVKNRRQTVDLFYFAIKMADQYGVDSQAETPVPPSIYDIIIANAN